MAIRKVSLMKPYVSQEAVKAVSQALQSGWMGQGPKVKEFEDKFCHYI
ncbi:unnamed protein product, partial [marine sediment metagenome]